MKMKQLLLSLLLFFSLVNAQDSSNVDFLVSFGINSSYVAGQGCQGKYEPHRRPGLHLSFAFERENRFSDYAGIEVAFEMRGGQFGRGFLDLGGGDYAVYDLNYLSLTPYFRFKSKISHLLSNFYVVLGFSFSLALDAKQNWVVETDEGWDYEMPPENFYDEISKKEIGLRYGLSFPVSSSWLLDVLYYKSLTELYSECKIYEYDLNNKCDSKNYSLTVRLGYRF